MLRVHGPRTGPTAIAGGASVKPGAIGRIFNAVLAEVKQQHGDDPVVAVTEEIGENSIGSTAGTAEALHTLVGRLLAVVRD